jgi:stage V sporulation protein SpoVS
MPKFVIEIKSEELPADVTEALRGAIRGITREEIQALVQEEVNVKLRNIEINVLADAHRRIERTVSMYVDEILRLENRSNTSAILLEMINKLAEIAVKEMLSRNMATAESEISVNNCVQQAVDKRIKEIEEGETKKIFDDYRKRFLDGISKLGETAQQHD